MSERKPQVGQRTCRRDRLQPRNPSWMVLVRIIASLVTCSVLGVATVTVAQDEPSAGGSLAPPANLVVTDGPYDNGTKLDLNWDLSPDDVTVPPAGQPRRVVQYNIYRAEGAEGDGDFRRITEATYQSTHFRDESCERGKGYRYRLIASGPGGESVAIETTEPVEPVLQWFDRKREWFAVILVICCGAIVYFINAARSGQNLKIRKIAGLEAVEEAVGRATEMGRPCLFVAGVQDINDMQTIAGLTVLSRVGQVAAEYGARIEMPTSRSLVMVAARETLQSACLAAGRPDAYNEDDVYYLTDEQFGFAAGVIGSMARQKHAACFYFGAFFAESLILAETGNSIGAIQVAGTAQPSQLPFFVAACDYTLIGEEFFAASAYLSHEPQQLGSLKGQDVGKVVAFLLLFVGWTLATIAVFSSPDTAESLHSAVTYVTENVLGDKGFTP